jgi:benzylsuccinate CoA-transferase BbsF subunit
MAQKPLDGVNVLDFCWVAVGPMTTKYLGEYGATVVRVESAKRPGTLRSAAPFPDGVAGINRSAYFASYNANKMGITVDMRHPRARELMLRLAGWAHIVTENFTPGTMEGWGLGFDELRVVNPSLVMFSASMMGRGGPMERQPGFGPVLSSLVGLTNVTGWPDRTPVNPYGAYTDFIVPRFAVTAILAALDHSRRTGEGRHLDLSQLETSLHFLTPFLLDYTANGREQGRQGNHDPGAAPHGVYPCVGDDRWLALACSTEGQWQAFLAAAEPEGGPLHAEAFATLLSRKANEDELDRTVAQWTAQHEQRPLMRMLQDAGVPAGAVNDPRDLFDDPQLQHRQHFRWLDHPEIGPYATDRSEFDLSLTPGSLDTPAPLLGQHTEHFLRNIIGLSGEEYRSLEADGVLE